MVLKVTSLLVAIIAVILAFVIVEVVESRPHQQQQRNHNLHHHHQQHIHEHEEELLAVKVKQQQGKQHYRQHNKAHGLSSSALHQVNKRLLAKRELSNHLEEDDEEDEWTCPDEPAPTASCDDFAAYFYCRASKDNIKSGLLDEVLNIATHIVTMIPEKVISLGKAIYHSIRSIGHLATSDRSSAARSAGEALNSTRAAFDPSVEFIELAKLITDASMTNIMSCFIAVKTASMARAEGFCPTASKTNYVLRHSDVPYAEILKDSGCEDMADILRAGVTWDQLERRMHHEVNEDIRNKISKSANAATNTFSELVRYVDDEDYDFFAHSVPPQKLVEFARKYWCHSVGSRCT